jgi:hypothetical protein
MVKFQLPWARSARRKSPHLTVAVTISRWPNAQSHSDGEAFAKILARFECFKFDANSRCIRVDIAQKAHGNANPSFKPVC